MTNDYSLLTIRHSLLITHHSSLIPHSSFRPQVLHGIAHGGPNCLETDGHKCDDHSQSSGQEENPPVDGNTVSKVFQPTVHGPPGQRHSYHKSNQYQPDEILRQELYNSLHTGAKYFSNSYLTRSLLCNKCGESEKTKAGNQNCQNGKK